MTPESPTAEKDAVCHYMPLAKDAEPSDFRQCLFCNELILVEGRWS